MEPNGKCFLCGKPAVVSSYEQSGNKKNLKEYGHKYECERCLLYYIPDCLLVRKTMTGKDKKSLITYVQNNQIAGKYVRVDQKLRDRLRRQG